jgi:hypothetical protein
VELPKYLENRLRATELALQSEAQKNPQWKMPFLTDSSDLIHFKTETIHAKLRPRVHFPIHERLWDSQEWKKNGIKLQDVSRILRCFADILGFDTESPLGYLDYQYKAEENKVIPLIQELLGYNSPKKDSLPNAAIRPEADRKTKRRIPREQNMLKKLRGHFAIMPLYSPYAAPDPKPIDFDRRGYGRVENLVSAHMAEVLFIDHEAQMVGFFHRPLSDILAVDIDDHNGSGPDSAIATSVLKRLLVFLDYREPVFLEKSIENGGYHAYFSLGIPLGNPQIQAIEMSFNHRYRATGHKIHCRKTSSGFRMILSPTYMAVLITNLHDVKNSKSATDSPDDMRLEELVLPTLSLAFKFILAHPLNDAPFDICALPVPARSKIAAKPMPAESPGNSKPVTENDRGHSPPNNINKTFRSDYPMLAGQRNTQMINLALAMAARECSLDEYIEAVIANQISSRDLAQWSIDKIREECRKKFDWAKKHADPYTGRRPSNMPRLTEAHKIQIATLARALMTSPKVFKKQKRRLIMGTEQLQTLITSIFGHAWKSISVPGNDTYEFRFSRNTLNKVCAEEKLTNPRFLFKLIQDSHALFYQHKKDPIGYRYYGPLEQQKSRQWRIYIERPDVTIPEAMEYALTAANRIAHGENPERIRLINLKARHQCAPSELTMRTLIGYYYAEYDMEMPPEAKALIGEIFGIQFLE